MKLFVCQNRRKLQYELETMCQNSKGLLLKLNPFLGGGGLIKASMSFLASIRLNGTSIASQGFCM